jgi:hypothetical protein
MGFGSCEGRGPSKTPQQQGESVGNMPALGGRLPRLAPQGRVHPRLAVGLRPCPKLAAAPRAPELGDPESGARL